MAHNTEKLRELLERVEKASGPDREIECRLFASLQYGYSYEEMVGVVPNLGQWACPAYTSSLDASIALVERLLPKHGWSVNDYGGAGRSVGCFIHTPGRAECSHETGKTVPLAVLATLLSVLISQAEGEGA